MSSEEDSTAYEGVRKNNGAGGNEVGIDTTLQRSEDGDTHRECQPRSTYSEWDWLEWNPSTGWLHVERSENETKQYMGFNCAAGSSERSPPPVLASTGIHICFLPKTEQLSGKDEHFCQHLSTTFSIPKLFWTHTGYEGNGYFWAGEELLTASGKADFASISRFLIKEVSVDPKLPPKEWYDWQYLGVASTWHKALSKELLPTVVVMCFDVAQKSNSGFSDQMMKRFASTLMDRDTKQMVETPMGIYAAMMETILCSFDSALWGFRKPIRDMEKMRQSIDTATRARYTEMHELSRHVIHATETIQAACQTTNCLCTHASGQAREDLLFYSRFFSALKLRANAFEQRLLNEIALAHHTIAAREVSTQEEILTSSRDILKETRSDGRDVANFVSIMTIFFLPGSFISGIFGMNMLSFAPDSETSYITWDGFHVSRLIFVPTVIMVGLTLIFLFLWYTGFLMRVLRNRHLGQPEQVAKQ